MAMKRYTPLFRSPELEPQHVLMSFLRHLFLCRQRWEGAIPLQRIQSAHFNPCYLKISFLGPLHFKWGIDLTSSLITKKGINKTLRGQQHKTWIFKYHFRTIIEISDYKDFVARNRSPPTD